MTVFDMNEIVPARRLQLQQEAKALKTPAVETKQCAAWKCDKTISHSHPGLKSIWCVDHTSAILFRFEAPPPRSRWQAWRQRRQVKQ